MPATSRCYVLARRHNGRALAECGRSWAAQSPRPRARRQCRATVGAVPYCAVDERHADGGCRRRRESRHRRDRHRRDQSCRPRSGRDGCGWPRCRPGPVPVTSRRLPRLSAAVPVPGHRQAARAAEPWRRPGPDAPAPGPGRPRPPPRAGDFLPCPLLSRFRVIDRLPEPPSPAAARGTLVHAVLEHLFDEPAAGRTPEVARSLLAPEWDRLAAQEPELAGLFESDAERATWLDEAAGMLDSYFRLEDPRRLEPAHRELSVRTVLASGLQLRGYIDRLDVAPSGDIRIGD